MRLGISTPGREPDMSIKISEPAFNDMNDEQFKLWAALLAERTGMEMPVQRKSYLVTSLGLRMQEISCANYDDYFQVLNSGVAGEVEWKYLIDRLTVHETRFFRHPASLKLVDEFVKAKAVDPVTGSVTVHAWSAACSTGEEAYTLAITIDGALKTLKYNSYFGVMATDISLPSIKVGRKGVYSEWRLEKYVIPELLGKYFELKSSGQYQVKEALRRRVCFSPMNVLDLKPKAIGGMDIIVCQNLLIYFDREKRFEIINAMADMLNPGGLMILGSGEIVGWVRPDIKKVDYPDTLVYQRLQSTDKSRHKVKV
ncbi:Chemotaxis protein methyltransferase CheR [hydrothermal vent metagenome]|uniref:protein-glutamate O-methyltransferase n=1 Tax=hydrothermal vent metagenome TaxID=652676 RepID=A0A3B0YW68_9ZZZZ